MQVEMTAVQHVPFMGTSLVRTDYRSGASSGAVPLLGRKLENLRAPLSPSHDSPEPQPRRCLKIAPQTPTRSGHPKKIVKFADDMGLDLTAVKVLIATPPSQSPEESATASAACAPKEPLKPVIVQSKAFLPTQNIKLDVCQSTGRYQAKFEQPGATANFWTRLRAQKVCLESVIASYNSSVHIVIRVLNIAFHKRVLLRYTLNNWSTFTDLEADYMPDCKQTTNSSTDRFSVNLCLRSSPRSVQFCVCYQVDNKEYWDNNIHQNYRMEFEENQQPTPFY